MPDSFVADSFVPDTFRADSASQGPEKFNPWREGEPEEDALTSLFHLPVHGLEQAIRGVSELANPGSRMRGAHNILMGSGKAALPFTLPEALIAAPVATAIGMPVGAAVGTAAIPIAESMGASPDAAQLAGDVSGIVAGGLTAKGVHNLPETLRNLSPETMKAAAKFAIGHKLGPLGKILAGPMVDSLFTTPPPDEPIGPAIGPYFHERTTFDPQFRGPITPPPDISPTPYSSVRGTVPGVIEPPPPTNLSTNPKFHGSVSKPGTIKITNYSAEGKTIPGTIEAPPSTTAEAPTASGPSLDDLSVSLANKPFKKLTPQEQSVVVSMHNKIVNETPSAKPAPTPTPKPVTVTPPPSAAPEVKDLGALEAGKENMHEPQTRINLHAEAKDANFKKYLESQGKFTKSYIDSIKTPDELIALHNKVNEAMKTSYKKSGGRSLEMWKESMRRLIDRSK